MVPPSGNVTFLFTDIEGSTRLWEKHTQSMGRALQQHDELLRATFEEHGGYVFKTVGDAFCVAFASARQGVLAAVAAQRKLAAAPWAETGQLRVRMALHSGEAEERDGDFFGPTLNRVARVLAVGHGGQILLSFVTSELAELGSEMSLRDLGERRLKDLSRPEHIFQLVVNDLPEEFPPLRSLEVLPNNLPAQVTTFVGRGNEMAEAKRLLNTARLVTLTGPGGTGKTRLSLQVAAEMLDRFPQGVWLVELATVSDGSLVPEVIANAVDIREELGRAPLATLIDALRDRRLLLVLDNCEHLLSACAETAETLLRRCPGVKILASSRQALNIDGETVQAVPPLTLGSMDWRSASLEQLAGLEAVQLFVERAAAVSPGFSLTPKNASLLAEICWRLDGLPLAIELAAARVKMFSLEQILERLDDRFHLLSGGRRTAQPRQQTLGALIDWSYDLLSEAERVLLRRLTVFVGGRTLRMAEEVCAGDGLDKREIADLLSGLVEKSLLMVEPGLAGENRYTLLESVWDYGDEKLNQHQETTRYRQRHLEFFVGMAEGLEPSLIGPDQKTALERLSVEQYNLNAALRNSREHPETIENGLRLAGAVSRYWEVHSYLTEGYEHLQALLAQAGQSVAPAILAKAQFAAGRLSWCQDRDADARGHYQIAQQIYRDLGQREVVGLLEAHLGLMERNDGNNQAARVHFESAIAMGEELQSKRVVGIAYTGLGTLAADEGDFARGKELKERSLSLMRELGDWWAVGLATGSLGRSCLRAGEVQQARRLIRESLSVTRDLGNKWAIPYALEALGEIWVEENQAEKAVRLYGASSVQREAFNLAFSSTERMTYQTALDRMHQVVPDDVFATAWEAGRSLPVKEAIDLALRS